MRLLLISLSLLSANYLRVCDKAEGGASASASADAKAAAAAAAAASASATSAVSVTAPRIGGHVVAVGDFNVEVVLHQSGLVEALVADARGALVHDGVKLSLTAAVKGSAREKIDLAFAPPRARFEGHAKAGAELVTGPVDVALEVAGKGASGKVAAAIALPRPRLGGHVVAAGGFSAEVLVRANGEVLAFVHDAAGAEVKGGADFKVRVHTTAGAREEIALAFDPGRACFVGKAKASAKLSPGPLEFIANADGKVSIGGLERVALSVDASHGGHVVAVGDYSVELVVDGKKVSAFVFDASGKAHAAGDLDLDLNVGAGAGTSLSLAWDAPTLSYVGKVKGDVDLSLEPIRVSLVTAGKAFAGGVASLKVAASTAAKAKLSADAKLAADAKLDADAKLRAGLDAKAKLSAPDVKAKASAAAGKVANASAGVKIEPPKVNLSATKSASAGAKTEAGTKAGAGAKASGGFSLGTK